MKINKKDRIETTYFHCLCFQSFIKALLNLVNKTMSVVVWCCLRQNEVTVHCSKHTVIAPEHYKFKTSLEVLVQSPERKSTRKWKDNVVFFKYFTRTVYELINYGNKFIMFYRFELYIWSRNVKHSLLKQSTKYMLIQIFLYVLQEPAVEDIWWHGILCFWSKKE